MLDGFLIFDLHDHRFMGADIGNRIGEQVGPLFFKQGRRLAIRLGGFINDLGFLPFLHFANNHPVSGDDLQGVHGGIIRQRENIYAFNPAIRRVFKTLGDDGAGGGARYRDIEVGGNPRRFQIFPVLVGLEQQASGLHVIGGDEGQLLFVRPRLAKQRQEQDEAEAKNRHDEIKAGFQIVGACECVHFFLRGAGTDARPRLIQYSQCGLLRQGEDFLSSAANHHYNVVMCGKVWEITAP